MTLLTFNTLHHKLLSGDKQQTIRKNVSYWSKRLDSNQKLDIWWLNPRNQHPDCYKIGIGEGDYEIKQGYDFTEEDASKDGFDNRQELIETLMRLHKLSRDEVRRAAWIIITWGWSDCREMEKLGSEAFKLV